MIEVLLEDPWFLVINKPIDLLTQAPSTIPSLQQQLIEQLAPTMQNTPFVGIPHRLDRMTSGALVVARNQRSLRRLCDQFAARTIRKEYLAWVYGRVPERGCWIDRVRKVPNEPRAEIVEEGSADARVAELTFENLGEVAPVDGAIASLVRVQLGTGRMHQIRIQFGSRGHSIIGDRLYGGLDFGFQPDRATREPPIALHASSIEFSHPKSGERVRVAAPLPREFPWSIPALESGTATLLESSP